MIIGFSFSILPNKYLEIRKGLLFIRSQNGKAGSLVMKPILYGIIKLVSVHLSMVL